MGNSIMKIIVGYTHTEMGFGALLMIVLIIVGFLGVLAGVRDWIRLIQIKTWPIADGNIVESKVSTAGSNESGYLKTIYSPIIKFKFNIEGHEFTSDKITWGGEFRSNDKSSIERKIAAFPVGKKIDVRYNPKKPSDCIVQENFSFEMAIPLFGGLLFMAFGSGILVVLTNQVIKQLIDKKLWP
jgi:hypothetical protein